MASVGRWKVVLVEAAELGRLRLGEIEACFEALGARLNLEASWRGAGLDRLLDEGHARLVGQIVSILRSLGWKVEVEVSFAVFGDRGSIDVFGWHESERALVVVEIKSELGAIDGLLRPLDVKTRHAAQIARERFGWQARSVSRIVVLPEDRTARRAVERHEAILDQSLPARSREVRAWLKRPVGKIAGLWFLSNDGSANPARNPSSIRRVRVANPRSAASDSTIHRGRVPLVEPHNVGESNT